MIISASRRTDIPAFYSNWFLNRISDGYILVRNPLFPKIVTKVVLDPKKIDAIIFWTKNPELLIEKLPELDERGFFFYFLFTITPYGKELEPNIPANDLLIQTFKHLSWLIGKDRVIWRYDPIILSDVIDSNFHLDKFYNLASSLKGATSECIVSFIVPYKKCLRNMPEMKIDNIDVQRKTTLLHSLKHIAENFDIKLTLCADENDIENIEPSCCIDIALINRLTGKRLPYKKDPGQRINCNCAESIDIGAYNSCMHNCLYCYANYDTEKVKETIHFHKLKSPMLIGDLSGNEQIKTKI